MHVLATTFVWPGQTLRSNSARALRCLSCASRSSRERCVNSHDSKQSYRCELVCNKEYPSRQRYCSSTLLSPRSHYGSKRPYNRNNKTEMAKRDPHHDLRSRMRAFQIVEIAIKIIENETITISHIRMISFQPKMIL